MKLNIIKSRDIFIHKLLIECKKREFELSLTNEQHNIYNRLYINIFNRRENIILQSILNI